jgi:hypothetical protein
MQVHGHGLLLLVCPSSMPFVPPVLQVLVLPAALVLLQQPLRLPLTMAFIFQLRLPVLPFCRLRKLLLVLAWLHTFSSFFAARGGLFTFVCGMFY